MSLHLISHPLCPYVQRAAISLAEKGVDYQRTYIDLAAKPDWFRALSPLGKTPVLVVDDTAIFESAVILEYLEETQRHPLHPTDPLRRARHRSWIEFGSAILNDIAGLYAAKDDAIFTTKQADLTEKFRRLEAELRDGPWFDAAGFSLVDAVFGPVFRYFDVFSTVGFDFAPAAQGKLSAWRQALAARPSVQAAVPTDYPTLLRAFLAKRDSVLGRMTAGAE